MARNNMERSEATRAALMDAAKALFLNKGYAETATPDVVAAAGVTRGALYHHFEDKKALFRAVIEREAVAVSNEIEIRAVPAATAKEALLLGAKGYFDAMATEGRTRLLLIEAPAVLGQDVVAAVDRENAEGALQAGLSDLLAKTSGKSGYIVQLTALLSAAFDRAAIEIAAGGDRKAFEAAIAELIEALARS